MPNLVTISSRLKSKTWLNVKPKETHTIIAKSVKQWNMILLHFSKNKEYGLEETPITCKTNLNQLMYLPGIQSKKSIGEFNANDTVKDCSQTMLHVKMKLKEYWNTVKNGIWFLISVLGIVASTLKS